jgi:methylmalonyl-CoA mutase N-terminal domain/subunit
MEEEEAPVEFHPFNEEACAEQVERLDRTRADRDNAAVKEALDKVIADAKADRNVMPSIITAVKAYASVGEITRCLVEVYGRYREPVRF